jgi:hypothetical protein
MFGRCAPLTIKQLVYIFHYRHSVPFPMKRLLLVLALGSPPPACFAAEPGPAPAPPLAASAQGETGLPLRARLTDELIGQAVRATLAAQPGPAASGADAALGAEPYREFARQMRDARVPDCLHKDGLKRQPTFFLRGWLALPFVAVAKLRGKCN